MIAHVAEGNSEDVNRAVAAARKAFDEGPWPKMTAYVFHHYLLCFFYHFTFPTFYKTCSCSFFFFLRVCFYDFIGKAKDNVACC